MAGRCIVAIICCFSTQSRVNFRVGAAFCLIDDAEYQQDENDFLPVR
jgi:hypothetical protein